MTQKKLKVLWIDDEDKRQQDAEHLCDRELDVEFRYQGIEEISPHDLVKYDLLLVDYRLDKVVGPAKPFRGPAIVGLLRSVDDDIPAYLVSGESPSERAKFSGLTWFEESLSLREIQEPKRMRVRLKNDISGYKAISKVARGQNADRAISKLLGVPKNSQKSLLEAIPASIKAAVVRSDEAPLPSGAPEASGRLGFARWVRRVLLVKPGPLLSSLHAATRVGMKVPRFEKTHAFAGARYDGIFAKSHEARWWASQLDHVVFDKQRRTGIASGLSWELGRELFDLSGQEQPTCAVCGERYPEIVARDVDTKKEAAVHQRHSNPDPERDFTPFFAEERVFQEGE
jgi:hypothetical protein